MWRHSAVRKGAAPSASIGRARIGRREPADGRHLHAVAGKGAVTPVEDLATDRENAHQVQRPGPPAPAHDVAVDGSSGGEPAIAMEQSEILDQLLGREAGTLGDPWGL